MKHLVGFLVVLTSLSAQALTIGAYNIRNFDYDERERIHTSKPELANIIRSVRADILNVEEIVNTAEFLKFVHTNLPGYEVALTNCGGAHGQHLGFIYNTATVDMLTFNEDLSVSEPGTPGSCYAGSRPLAIALFQVKATKQKFYGIGVHLKSGSAPADAGKRTKQFEILKAFVMNLRATTGIKDLYIAGDMNTTEYVTRGNDFKVLTSVVSALGMVDLTQNLPCSAYWWGGTDDGIESPSLLDHVIVTPGLLKTSARAQAYGHCQKVACRPASLADLGISYKSVSDHCPVAATIQ